MMPTFGQLSVAMAMHKFHYFSRLQCYCWQTAQGTKWFSNSVLTLSIIDSFSTFMTYAINKTVTATAKVCIAARTREIACAQRSHGVHAAAALQYQLDQLQL